VRRALERRYRLMPHLYTLFEEAHRMGMPVARPLFFADPADASLRDVGSAFLLGDDLLVSARPTKSGRNGHAMPRGAWVPFDFPGFDGGRDSDDPDQARLLLRGGGIVPTGPVHQHFGDRPDQRDEITLLVALDEHGKAEGALYEDAGEGWGFREGELLRTVYTAQRHLDDEQDRVVVRTRTVGGTMPRPERALRVRLLLDEGREVTASGVDGQTLEIRLR
jgi:alpha-glucosidase (family GH31 glycosyl hydrolase)